MGLKTLFVITIVTARMVFPGIPILPDTDPGAVPNEAAAVSKSVVIELTSGKRPAQGQAASARVDVPEGLGVGPSVKLVVNAQVGLGAAVGSSSTSPAKVTSKTYWGSSNAVIWGQPKVEEIIVTPPARDRIASYAYWPAGNNDEKVAGASARVAGKYTLTTNYCEQAAITLTDAQNYLAPINLLGLSDKIDLEKPIKVKWTPVARAVGYVVTAFGGNAKESITWTSSSKPEVALDITNSPVGKENLDGYIKDKVLLPPYLSVCTIPAGIFKGSASVMITVTAVGTDIIQQGQDIDTQVLVRSIASVPITMDSEAPATPKE